MASITPTKKEAKRIIRVGQTYQIDDSETLRFVLKKSNNKELLKVIQKAF